MNLDEIKNIELEGFNYMDTTDFSDVYISNAEYKGVKLTEKELEELNNNQSFVQVKAEEFLS